MFRRSKRTEAAFRSDLIKHLELHGAVAVPVESRATTRGLADLLVVWGGATALIELKDVHGKETPALRPSQRAFSRRASKAGARYFLVARHADHHFSLRDPREEHDAMAVICTTVEGMALTLLKFTQHQEVA